MRTFKGICNKTNGIETIYCEVIHCPTMNNPSNFTLGIMRACSADLSGKNLCYNCSILQVVEELNNDTNDYKGESE